MASNPHKPGTPEWQAWLDAQIEAHDAENEKRDVQIELAQRERARRAAEEGGST